MSPLFIVAATIVAAFAVCFAVGGLFHATGLLRDRFGEAEHFELADLALGPAWLVLELVCFIINIIVTLLMLWLAVDAARSARDWWHAGSKR